MQKRTTGVILSAKKQWWLKINKKMIRTGPLDGAAFPYIIKVKYVIDGKEYVKRKWISAGAAVPAVGSAVKVVYDTDAPKKAELQF